MVHASRELRRFGIGRVVSDGSRIEYHDVGIIACPEQAAIGQGQILRGQAGQLADRLGLSQQNTSKHLGVLAAAGVVERTRAGNSVVYAIGDPTVFALCDLVCGALRDRITALQGVVTPEHS